jgi:hypothetical protein
VQKHEKAYVGFRTGNDRLEGGDRVPGRSGINDSVMFRFESLAIDLKVQERKSGNGKKKFGSVLMTAFNASGLSWDL